MSVHIVEYIVKGSRPRKPMVILWGTATQFHGLFRKPTDIAMAELSIPAILQHVLDEPLFVEPATLWVPTLPNLEMIENIKYHKVFQHVVFANNTKDPEPELDKLWQDKAQIVQCTPLTPGSKNHKMFIEWFIRLEFKEHDLSQDALDLLIDLSAERFSDDVFYSCDNLAKFCYLLPSGLSKLSKATHPREFAGLRQFLDKITEENWHQLLHLQEEPLLNEFVQNFFRKSRRTYESLRKFLITPEPGPLALCKALTQRSTQYLNCVWSKKEASGSQNPAAIAQGKLVPRFVFQDYTDHVARHFGEPHLWALAKDVSLLQARLRQGEAAEQHLYALCFKFLGGGL